MATPTIIDTLPVSVHTSSGTSHSFSYDSGSTGSNRLLLVFFANGGPGDTINFTYNSVSMTRVDLSASTGHQTYSYYFYLAAPDTGSHTLAMSKGAGNGFDYIAFTMQDADQSTPIDSSSVGGGTSTSSTRTWTTNSGNTGLVDYVVAGNSITLGGGETTVLTSVSGNNGNMASGFKAAAASAGSESMSASFSNGAYDHFALAIKYASSSTPANMKTYNTNTAANVKTIDTNLKANVKTLDTNV